MVEGVYSELGNIFMFLHPCNVIFIIVSHCSFLSHSSYINNLLEGLDGVLKNWLNRLHDTKSSLHIINLWLHAFDGLHFSSNFNEWLSIIKSLEDSGGKSFLDVLDGSGLGDNFLEVLTSLTNFRYVLDFVKVMILLVRQLKTHDFDTLILYFNYY